jgi:hypothetical protein
MSFTEKWTCYFARTKCFLSYAAIKGREAHEGKSGCQSRKGEGGK